MAIGRKSLEQVQREYLESIRIGAYGKDADDDNDDYELEFDKDPVTGELVRREAEKPEDTKEKHTGKSGGSKKTRAARKRPRKRKHAGKESEDLRQACEEIADEIGQDAQDE